MECRKIKCAVFAAVVVAVVTAAFVERGLFEREESTMSQRMQYIVGGVEQAQYINTSTASAWFTHNVMCLLLVSI